MNGSLLNVNQIKDYIIQQESAREETDLLEQAGSVSHQSTSVAHATKAGFPCRVCGNKGHKTEDCTKSGPMCYRCRRYEGHLASRCPYTDEDLRAKNFRGEQRSDARNKVRQGGISTNRRRSFEDPEQYDKRKKLHGNEKKISEGDLCEASNKDSGSSSMFVNH